MLEAVLGNASRNGSDYTEAVLAAARATGVDPLDYCARLGVGDAVAMERAAHWAGYAFSGVVPQAALPMESIERLDQLAGVRTFRSTLLGREVTFCAPRFDDLLRLAKARSENPDLVRRLCMVPARALRTRLTHAASEQLMGEARQRLTRRWPFARADVDLPR